MQGHISTVDRVSRNSITMEQISLKSEHKNEVNKCHEVGTTSQRIVFLVILQLKWHLLTGVWGYGASEAPPINSCWLHAL